MHPFIVRAFRVAYGLIVGGQVGEFEREGTGGRPERHETGGWDSVGALEILEGEKGVRGKLLFIGGRNLLVN